MPSILGEKTMEYDYLLWEFAIDEKLLITKYINILVQKLGQWKNMIFKLTLLVEISYIWFGEV